jgi:hypothetical protein
MLGLFMDNLNRSSLPRSPILDLNLSPEELGDQSGGLLDNFINEEGIYSYDPAQMDPELIDLSVDFSTDLVDSIAEKTSDISKNLMSPESARIQEINSESETNLPETSPITAPPPTEESLQNKVAPPPVKQPPPPVVVQQTPQMNLDTFMSLIFETFYQDPVFVSSLMDYFVSTGNMVINLFDPELEGVKNKIESLFSKIVSKKFKIVIARDLQINMDSSTKSQPLPKMEMDKDLAMSFWEMRLRDYLSFISNLSYLLVTLEQYENKRKLLPEYTPLCVARNDGDRVHIDIYASRVIEFEMGRYVTTLQEKPSLPNIMVEGTPGKWYCDVTIEQYSDLFQILEMAKTEGKNPPFIIIEKVKFDPSVLANTSITDLFTKFDNEDMLERAQNHILQAQSKLSSNKANVPATSPITAPPPEESLQNKVAPPPVQLTPPPVVVQQRPVTQTPNPQMYVSNPAEFKQMFISNPAEYKSRINEFLLPVFATFYQDPDIVASLMDYFVSEGKMVINLFDSKLNGIKNKIEFCLSKVAAFKFKRPDCAKFFRINFDLSTNNSPFVEMEMDKDLAMSFWEMRLRDYILFSTSTIFSLTQEDYERKIKLLPRLIPLCVARIDGDRIHFDIYASEVNGFGVVRAVKTFQDKPSLPNITVQGTPGKWFCDVNIEQYTQLFQILEKAEKPPFIIIERVKYNPSALGRFTTVEKGASNREANGEKSQKQVKGGSKSTQRGELVVKDPNANQAWHHFAFGKPNAKAAEKTYSVQPIKLKKRSGESGPRSNKSDSHVKRRGKRKNDQPQFQEPEQDSLSSDEQTEFGERNIGTSSNPLDLFNTQYTSGDPSWMIALKQATKRLVPAVESKRVLKEFDKPLTLEAVRSLDSIGQPKEVRFFQSNLLSYQRKAVQEILTAENSFSKILSLEMGLGKTITAIEVLFHWLTESLLKQDKKKFVVVAQLANFSQFYTKLVHSKVEYDLQILSLACRKMENRPQFRTLFFSTLAKELNKDKKELNPLSYLPYIYLLASLKDAQELKNIAAYKKSKAIIHTEDPQNPIKEWIESQKRGGNDAEVATALKALKSWEGNKQTDLLLSLSKALQTLHPLQEADIAFSDDELLKLVGLLPIKIFSNQKEKMPSINDGHKVIMLNPNAIKTLHIARGNDKWGGFIFDEAQELANEKTNKQKEVVTFLNSSNAKECKRLFLTGTPFQNDSKDLWNLLSVANPQAFPPTVWNVMDRSMTQAIHTVYQIHKGEMPDVEEGLTTILTAFSHYFQFRNQIISKSVLIALMADQDVQQAWNGKLPKVTKLNPKVEIEGDLFDQLNKVGVKIGIKSKTILQKLLLHPSLEGWKASSKDELEILTILKTGTREQKEQIINESQVLKFTQQQIREQLGKGKTQFIIGVDNKYYIPMLEALMVHMNTVDGSHLEAHSFDGESDANARSAHQKWFNDRAVSPGKTKVLIFTATSGGVGVDLPMENGSVLDLTNAFHEGKDKQFHARAIRAGTDAGVTVVTPEFVKQHLNTPLIIQYHSKKIKETKRMMYEFYFKAGDLNDVDHSLEMWFKVMEGHLYHKEILAKKTRYDEELANEEISGTMDQIRGALATLKEENSRYVQDFVERYKIVAPALPVSVQPVRVETVVPEPSKKRSIEEEETEEVQTVTKKAQVSPEERKEKAPVVPPNCMLLSVDSKNVLFQRIPIRRGKGGRPLERAITTGIALERNPYKGRISEEDFQVAKRSTSDLFKKNQALCEQICKPQDKWLATKEASLDGLQMKYLPDYTVLIYGVDGTLDTTLQQHNGRDKRIVRLVKNAEDDYDVLAEMSV